MIINNYTIHPGMKDCVSVK